MTDPAESFEPHRRRIRGPSAAAAEDLDAGEATSRAAE
jgi:hypothetical protein